MNNIEQFEIFIKKIQDKYCERFLFEEINGNSWTRHGDGWFTVIRFHNGFYIRLEFSKFSHEKNMYRKKVNTNIETIRKDEFLKGIEEIILKKEIDKLINE